MDFPPTYTIPRKNQPSTVKKSKKGRPIIQPPSESNRSTQRYHNNRSIDLSNDREYYNDHCTNDHINDMNNPGDGSSDSSHSKFSEGEPERRRRQEQHDRQKNVAHKRKQTKQDQFAASQRKWDNKREGYSMNGAYDHASNQSMRSFDGIRTDKPMTEKAARAIHNDRVQQLKKPSRGKNHNASAFAMLEGSGKKRGSPFAGDGVEDPLDLAQEQQGSDRKSRRRQNTNFTQKMGSNMETLISGQSLETVV